MCMDFWNVMAKTLYGCWCGHPCSVGVAGPNIAGVLIIEAEKCTLVCTVIINVT